MTIHASHSHSGLQSLVRFAVPGAAVAAFAAHAHAAIIYTDVNATISTTSDTLRIDLGNGVGGGGAVSINDTISGEDFVLEYRNTNSTSDGDSLSLDKPYITSTGSSNGEVADSSLFAAKFSADDLIFDATTFFTNRAIYDGTFSGSPWAPGDTGYLGVRFTDASSALHYGWIDLTYGIDKSLTVNGFAYETTADAPVYAGVIPEPASAAAMAAALAGSVALFRRRQVRA